MAVRFAHISDLHFGTFSLNPLQLFSKRWLGNLNFIASRKKFYAYGRLGELIDLFKKEQITHVIISGDLSVTAHKREFKMGQRFVDLLRENGFTVFVIPGNHDFYTKGSERKNLFYQFFPSQFSKECPLKLDVDGATYIQINRQLWLVGIDTAVATSLISSNGNFSPHVEEGLEKALSQIPSSDRVILLNHFPFLQTGVERHALKRRDVLKAILEKHPNIFLYLHGHTHIQTVADLRPNRLPIVSDAGSTPHTKHGALHLLSIDNKSMTLEVYRYDGHWGKEVSHEFSLD